MSLFRLACNLLIGTTPPVFSESLFPDYTQTFTTYTIIYTIIQEPVVVLLQ